LVRKYVQRRPDDFNVNFRQGAVFRTAVRHTGKYFARALVMPSCEPPLLSASDVERYLWQVRTEGGDKRPGTVLAAMRITPTTTPRMISEAKDVIAAAAIYMSDFGETVADVLAGIGQQHDTLKELQDANIVLSLHGDLGGEFCLDREKRASIVLVELARMFPRLRMVMETISTEETVTLVEQLPSTVAATITAQHLLLTLQDILGKCMKSHLFCHPLPRYPEDRNALRRAAMSGNPKFFFGSGSMPLLKKAKINGCCQPGVYSSPVSFPILLQIFEEEGELPKLEDFTSKFGAQHYGMKPNQGQLALIASECKVASEYEGPIIPLYAGKTLDWELSVG